MQPSKKRIIETDAGDGSQKIVAIPVSNDGEKSVTESSEKVETTQSYAARTILMKGPPNNWIASNLKTKFLDKNNIEYEDVFTYKKSAKFWIVCESVEKKNEMQEKLKDLKCDQGKKKKMRFFEADPDANWCPDYKKGKLTDTGVRKKQEKKVVEIKSSREVLIPWADTPYDKQCLKKWRTVRKSMLKLLKELKTTTPYDYHWMDDEAVTHPIGCLASPDQENYRNKDSFTMGIGMDGKKLVGCRLGSTVSGTTQIGDVAEGIHLHHVSRYLVTVATTLIQDSPYDVHDRPTHKGLWRSLVVRMSHVTKQVLVVVIIQISDFPEEQQEEKYAEVKASVLEHFAKEKEVIQEKFGYSLEGIIIQKFSGMSDVVPIDHPYDLLFGNAYLTEMIEDLQFRVSFQSFFQVNVPQATRMFEIAGKWASVSNDTVLFDICCGAGTIGLSLAKYVKHVVGLEIIPEAVKDANQNMELNNIKNATFICGKAEVTIDKALKEHKDSDIVAIVDPPRSGLHPTVLRAIRANNKIKRLVYISCKPASLADDCVKLCRGISNRYQGMPFKPVKSLAVDMFPHTPHTEMILLLERTTEEDTTKNTQKRIKMPQKRKWHKRN